MVPDLKVKQPSWRASFDRDVVSHRTDGDNISRMLLMRARDGGRSERDAHCRQPALQLCSALPRLAMLHQTVWCSIKGKAEKKDVALEILKDVSFARCVLRRRTERTEISLSLADGD
jgi:hypothetical protein